MSQQWYNEWFDSEFYHILYKRRDQKEAKFLIDNLISTLKIDSQDPHHILDLACGKGRHAVYLNSLGYKVTGLDLSTNSINEAKKSENERLFFNTHDMREVFKENEFSHIFNLFTSFGYFDEPSDNQKVIDSCHKMLKKDGIIVLDYLNAHKTISNLVEDEFAISKDLIFDIRRSVENGFIVKKIGFIYQEQKFNYTERVKILYQQDFEKLFANWEICNIYGSYDFLPFDKEKSDRLIFVCKKIAD